MSSDKKAIKLWISLESLKDHKRRNILGSSLPAYDYQIREASLEFIQVLPSTDSPLNQDVEKEIEEASKKLINEPLICGPNYIREVQAAYRIGAREFVKRTEERVWREGYELLLKYFAPSSHYCRDHIEEGIRKGYIK